MDVSTVRQWVMCFSRSNNDVMTSHGHHKTMNTLISLSPGIGAVKDRLCGQHFLTTMSVIATLKKWINSVDVDFYEQIM